MSTSMREDIVNFERDNDLGGQLTNVAYCPTAYEESTHDNYLLAQVDVLNAQNVMKLLVLLKMRHSLSDSDYC